MTLRARNHPHRLASAPLLPRTLSYDPWMSEFAT